MPMQGDLQVWHIPQVPGTSFDVSVASPAEAVRIMAILADYDIFQFEQKIKPDYNSAQGLQVFEDGEWVDWYDHETGNDIDVWAAAQVA